MREWSFEIKFKSGKHNMQVWTYTNLMRKELVEHYDNLSISILRDADITIRFGETTLSIDEFLQQVYGADDGKVLVN